MPSPDAVKMYAEKMKLTPELVVLQRDQFNPKEAMLAGPAFADLDGVMHGCGGAEVSRQAADQGRSWPSCSRSRRRGSERAATAAHSVIARTASRTMQPACRPGLLRLLAVTTASSSPCSPHPASPPRFRSSRRRPACIVPAEFAHLALALDRAGRSSAARRQAPRSVIGGLLHLGGAADAVARHALDVVGRPSSVQSSAG